MDVCVKVSTIWNKLFDKFKGNRDAIKSRIVFEIFLSLVFKWPESYVKKKQHLFHL